MVERHLFPLHSANEPTKLLSFAAIHWASSSFLITRLFQEEYMQVSGISVESQVVVLHYHRDFGGLSAFRPVLDCVALSCQDSLSHQQSPQGPTLFNMYLNIWHSTGRLLKALCKCSAGKHLGYRVLSPPLRDKEKPACSWLGVQEEFVC